MGDYMIDGLIGKFFFGAKFCINDYRSGESWAHLQLYMYMYMYNVHLYMYKLYMYSVHLWAGIQARMFSRCHVFMYIFMYMYAQIDLTSVLRGYA